MSSPRTRLALLLSLVLALPLASGGCGDRKAKQAELERDKRRVTADSTRDATEAVVDEAYRFRLDHPGEGWKTLDHNEAGKLGPDFEAAAIYSTTITATVTVEHMADLSLDGYVDLLLDTSGDTIELLDRRTIEFVGLPAIQLDAKSSAGGLISKHQIIVVGRAGWYYTLDAWSRADTPTSELERIFDFFDAFSLLDGEVVPRRSPIVPIAEAQGIGWRIREGVFESSVTGLRVGTEEPFRLAIGGELDEMDPDAELAFIGEAPALYATVTPSQWATPKLERARAEQLAQLESDYPGQVQANALTLSILNDQVPMSGWTDSGMRYYTGTVELTGILATLSCWWSTDADATGRVEIAKLAQRFELLDESARAALAGELAGIDDPQRAVGAGWTVRGREYLDFDTGVRWRKPDGATPWSFATGPGAATWDEDAKIVLIDLRSGNYASLVPVPGGGPVDDAAWTEIRAKLWPGVALTGKTSMIEIGAGARGTIHYGEIELDDGRVTPSSLVLIERGPVALALSYSSTTSAKDHARELDGILAGLELDAGLQEIDQTGGRWTDHRMGISLMPAAGWATRDETPPAMASIGRGTVWTRDGSAKLMLMAILPIDIGQDRAWVDSFMEQIARDAFGAKTKDVVDRRERKIAGVDARTLRWDKPRPLVVSLLRKGAVLVLLIEFTPNDKTVAAVVETIEFL